jgi:hypothetical protein
VAPSTVRTTIKRFHAAGLDWPLLDDMTDVALEARLFPDAGTKRGHRRLVEPDWASIHRELKRKHVTLSILWDEYIACNPEGYRYSRFCELYRVWEGKLSVTVRQTHVGGDKLFVDYAGDTVPVIVDRLTGEVRQAQIFVAVMGASNFTYVEATWTQAAIGSVPTPGPWQPSAACRVSSFPTTPRSRSSRPVSTSPKSIEPMPRWQRITAPPCCRPGPAGRATKPRSKLACSSSNVGSSVVCVIIGSTVSPS